MLDRIIDHWEHWARTGRARRQLALWARTHPALAGWTLDALREPRSSARTDAMQAALVDLAQRGDQAALTTLTTQLRPGLVRLVRWTRASSPTAEGTADTEGDVLAVFCETVLSHSLRRRPRSIAANLLLDTRQQIWRAGGRASRRRDAQVRAIRARPAVVCPQRPELCPDAAVGALDLVSDLTAAVGALPASAASRRLTAEVAFRAWILDEPSTDIARDVGLRPEAVRARLSRLRAAVRSSASAPSLTPST